MKPATGAFRNAAIAGVMACVVVATEYFFRHYVLFWLPTLGSLRVNDMLVLALAYSSLTFLFGSLAQAHWHRELRELAQALHDFTTRWTYIPWLLGLMLSLVLLPFLDQWLWSGLRFPMRVSGYRNPAIWLAAAATALEVVARLGVNGILVPIAEEYLWRGHIQARLMRVLPASGAIAITAILFSLKHVVVDASWGRFLTLTAFGAICGIVAQRGTWRSSAALHLVVNTATTAVALAMGKD